MNFLLLFWVGVSKLWSKFHVNVCFPNCIAVLVAGPFVLWWDLTPLLCILSIFLWLKLAIIHYSIFCSLLFHRFFVFFLWDIPYYFVYAFISQYMWFFIYDFVVCRSGWVCLSLIIISSVSICLSFILSFFNTR